MHRILSYTHKKKTKKKTSVRCATVRYRSNIGWFHYINIYLSGWWWREGRDEEKISKSLGEKEKRRIQQVASINQFEISCRNFSILEREQNFEHLVTFPWYATFRVIKRVTKQFKIWHLNLSRLVVELGTMVSCSTLFEFVSLRRKHKTEIATFVGI